MPAEDDQAARHNVLRLLADHRTEIQRFGVESLSVFGSVARGDVDPESDVDVLVEFREPVGLFRFLDLKAYLEELLSRNVDLVTEDALKHQLRDQILREAVRAV